MYYYIIDFTGMSLSKKLVPSTTWEVIKFFIWYSHKVATLDYIVNYLSKIVVESFAIIP